MRQVESHNFDINFYKSGSATLIEDIRDFSKPPPPENY
jgi:hypothetical protein